MHCSTQKHTKNKCYNTCVFLPVPVEMTTAHKHAAATIIINTAGSHYSEQVKSIGERVRKRWVAMGGGPARKRRIVIKRGKEKMM